MNDPEAAVLGATRHPRLLAEAGVVGKRPASACAWILRGIGHRRSDGGSWVLEAEGDSAPG